MKSLIDYSQDPIGVLYCDLQPIWKVRLIILLSKNEFLKKMEVRLPAVRPTGIIYKVIQVGIEVIKMY